MLIDWNDTLVLGDARIDEEHRELVMVINRLFRALEQGADRDEVCDVAFTLGEQVTQHFNSEIELMEASGYPGAAAHQREHKRLMEELGAALHRIGREADGELLKVASFIEGWFVIHVTTADAQFVRFLNDTALQEEPLPASW